MTAGERATIRVEHVYAHPPSKVWRALTDPAKIALWWGPGDVRAEVGHRFDMDMGPWGKQPCEVIAVEHERLFRYRFVEPTLNTIITWQLTPKGNGTRLTLIHEGFNLETAMGARAYEGMKSGWPGVLERLGRTMDA